ncbi:LysR family transcriptional regulator [Rhizobium sp. S153]|uniref:LysR family transcriptional regulator n=1 Tax=Ciceribacter sichuanensis TaxID=2949647 RepID=A0ABT0VB79_9HYPH|nr:LysR family transcriptional regulator [Ciceribacter sp. S153]MCM2403140.1 LysR family transcriptional regulator [Ciceribacter sp. S153]
MKNIAWDGYQLFIEVARRGGLTGAASASGLSPATIGRRMVELERQLGRELFLRSQTGYRLTDDGHELLTHLGEMEAAIRRVETWRQGASARALVRIAAGTWVARLISQNFSAICTARDDFRIDLFIAEQRASLAHREADIGIRAFEPEEQNLAKVLLGEVAYAAYKARNNVEAEVRWLAVDTENAISSYLRWPHENRPESIVVTVNRPHALRDLALAGAGVALLPCIVGDLEPRLERVGGEIEVLRHRQWIVMNNDDRHRPEIRVVVDRMTRLMRAHADLFAGRRPSSEG